MPGAQTKRNYLMSGPENKQAHDKGLASAEWYTCPIPRARMKDLMKRKDWPGIRDTVIWLALLAGSGYLAYLSWGTWWAVPAFLLYGILYCTNADAMWHETGHRTAFKSEWINEILYHLSAFMTLKPATSARWSHTHHHTDTVIVGLDPEIRPRPPVWIKLMIEMVKLNEGPRDLKRNLMHFFGKLNREERAYIPHHQRSLVFLEARIRIVILLGIAAWCIAARSILPALFIGLPTFYGFGAIVILTLSQHLGLCEDVLDHRLNTRTYYLNPIGRFLYMNMNYHTEHHMFPMVPYHALPALHEEMKADCPQPSPSLWAALKEVVIALQKQRKDYTYSLVRRLPPTARPYRFGSGSDPIISPHGKGM